MIDFINRIFNISVDERLFLRELGERIYLSNGRSWFCGGDDKFLLENNYLKIGFGKSVSGYGDWGGGATRSITSPLKIYVDTDMVVKKVETDSFYNSKDSKIKEDRAKSIKERIPIGERLKIYDEEIEKNIIDVLSLMPTEDVIGWDMFENPHMKPTNP